MERIEIIRHFLGYIVGIFVFLILIPIAVFVISTRAGGVFTIPIVPNGFGNIVLAVLLFISGMIFAIWSNVDLFVMGKGGPTDVFNFAISPRTKHLVKTGPYRYSRNPMTFGMTAVYAAIACYVNSLITLLLVFLFMGVMAVYLRMTEEKRLLRDFGDEYREYTKEVSMIIPLPQKSGNRERRS